MRKQIVIALIVILFLAGFAVFTKSDRKQVLSGQSKIINYLLENKKYRLLVADKPDEWSKGLMYYRKLDAADGMIFLFPDKKTRNFWNKNTFMDLDLYWIDDSRVIGKSKLPSIEKSREIVVVSSQEPVNKVIELAR